MCLILKTSLLCQDECVSFLIQKETKREVLCKQEMKAIALNFGVTKQECLCCFFIFPRHWANKCSLVYSFSGFDSGSKNPFPMRDFLNLVKSPEKSGFQPKPINT